MMFVYVGSRTTRERNARGDGISVYRCDTATGALDLVQVLGDLVNPSFLALNKSGDRLYAVHGDCEEISAFSVEASSGRITLLNRQSTQGRNPVHLALDPTERFVVVSNHITSSLAVLPLQADGSLGACVQLVPIEGEPGPHRKEQPFAKPHFNPFDPSGRHVLIPDKGLDKVLSFRFSDGRLQPSAQPEMLSRESSGPRHLAFHPRKPWAYVINELDSTVTACRWDADSGGLTPFQIISAMADTYTGNSRASEIEVHPSGRTLYASNRGEDTLGVMRVDEDTGRIELIQSMPCGGKTPRFFTLTPDGRFMHVLNEDSDSIVTLAVDDASGRLSPTGLHIACGSPVCLVYRRG
jgi:6-phosphogluconolactonase (cycloisomerase 2 family)